jgi:hypothetical protein
MRFEVLTVVNMSMVFFWDETPCGLVNGYQYLERTYSLHLQGY